MSTDLICVIQNVFTAAEAAQTKALGRGPGTRDTFIIPAMWAKANNAFVTAVDYYPKHATLNQRIRDSIWEVMNQLLLLTLVSEKINSVQRLYVYMSCCYFTKNPNVLNMVDRTGDEFRDARLFDEKWTGTKHHEGNQDATVSTGVQITKKIVV